MGLINKILKNKKEEDVADDKSKGSVKDAKKLDKKKDVKTKKVRKTVLGEQSYSDKILLSPLITEKAAREESINKYSFIVAKNANKFQIKKAVEEIYGVKTVKISTVNVEGKRIKSRRVNGKKSDYKKAIVTLQKGKTIDIHKGV